MTYNFKIIDISNSETEDELRMLYKAAFKNPVVIPKGYLFKNTNTNASLPTYFIAAIDNGNIVGCSAFIPFDFYKVNVLCVGYQIVWSATLPEYQGQRVYVNLIDFAKKYLKTKGASFLFANSNHSSHPIFVNKLGFKTVPNSLLKIPNIPILKKYFFKNSFIENNIMRSREMLHPDEFQIINWKKQEHREKIEVVNIGESFLWGKVLYRKLYGIKITFFYVGGIRLESSKDALKLVNKIFSTYKIYYVQIVSIETNPLNNLFSSWTKNEMSGFNFFDLTHKLDEKFNLMYGIVDTF